MYFSFDPLYHANILGTSATATAIDVSTTAIGGATAGASMMATKTATNTGKSAASASNAAGKSISQASKTTGILSGY